MTTELEQKFFKVFEIDEQCVCPYFPEYMENGCEICIKYFQGKKDCNEKNQYKYPEITAEKLLEMIIIRAINYKSGTVIELEPDSNIEDLKYEVLRHFIDYRGYFNKYQIQQLFKGDKGIVDNNV